MKKLVFGLLMALAVNCNAGWIEENAVNCGNTLYCGDIVSTSGIVNVREFFQNVPAADSDTLKTPTGTMVISTAALVAFTTTFADASYFNVSKYPRRIGISYDIDFDTNCPAGTFTITGTDGRGQTVSEIVTVLGTTIAYSNIAFQRITSATLGVTFRGTDRFLGVFNGNATPYGDMAKIYPRVGIGAAVGLQNIPVSSTVLMATENDTGKPTSYATIDLQYGTVTFGSAPNATNEYEVGYKARGAR